MVAGPEAARRFDLDDDVIRGWGSGRQIPRRGDDDPPDADRRQIGLRTASPVFVLDIDRTDLDRTEVVERGHRGTRRVTRVGRAEVRGPAAWIGEMVLFDRHEVVIRQERDQPVAGGGRHGGRELNDQRG